MQNWAAIIKTKQIYIYINVFVYGSDFFSKEMTGQVRVCKCCSRQNYVIEFHLDFRDSLGKVGTTVFMRPWDICTTSAGVLGSRTRHSEHAALNPTR